MSMSFAADSRLLRHVRTTARLGAFVAAIAAVNAASAQDAACRNGNFSDGLTGWTVEGGAVSGLSGAFRQRLTGWAAASPLCQNNNSGGKYCIALSSPGADPAVSLIASAFGGTGQSLRLGGTGASSDGKAAERLSRTFTVTPANAQYFFKYAIVMDPSHEIDKGTAFFHAYAVDSSGNLVDEIVEPAESTNPFIQKTTNTSYGDEYYRDWRCTSLDLSSKVGQQVTVYFANADCGQGAHRGHTYIDDVCVACGTDNPEGGVFVDAIADRCTRTVTGQYAIPTRPDLTGHRIELDIYKNGALVTTVINGQYANGTFSFDLSGLDRSLGCFDVVARQEFAVKDLSGNPQTVTQLSSSVPASGQQDGTTPGLDNDVCMDCGGTPTGGGDASGIVKICKVASTGVKTGSNFTFSAGASRVTVPAGPGPDGYCAIAGTDFPVGKTVRVTETGPYGYGVTGISVAPRERQAGRADLAGKLVDVLVGAGVTEVTFVNEKRTGYLEICKTGDATGDFVFEIPALGQKFTVPAGACTPAIEVAAGDLEIVEQSRAGAAMRGCRTLPDGRLVSCNTRRQTAVVRIEAGDISTQTILLVENRATGAKPDPSGPAPADSTSTPAPVDTTPADPGVDPPTVPQSPIGRKGSASSGSFGDYRLADFDGTVAAGPTYATLACRPEGNRVRCTATMNAAERGAARPRGLVAFRRGGATIAALPLKRDGTADLILPSTDNMTDMEAALLETPPPARRSTDGFRFYRPGEAAPDDNSAARLNCGIVNRASGLFSLTLRERCRRAEETETAQ